MNLDKPQTKHLTAVGTYQLKKPLTVTISYDTEDKLFGAVNEELALFGYGENETEALQSLEQELEGHLISYTAYPDTQHSKTSLELKKRLQEHISIEEAGILLEEKYKK